MVLSKKNWPFLILLSIFPFFAAAQERPILDWNFFKNDRPANAEHQAYTWAIVSYRYQPTQLKGDKMEVQFEVKLKMDTARSYFQADKRAAGSKLLKHEQGHADISCIYARKLKEKFTSATYSANHYQKEIKAIFDEVFAEMNAEQLRYDAETNHSMNASAQQKWDSYFSAQLEGK
ncbi:MAG: DUF922 domain-containing protein [Pedobacter sp.]|nr:DUF922 domain-containing protein [Pedobacter sp.]MDQ8052415.1 DUF922 domain-containing protein [Pedobacter sp.]